MADDPLLRLLRSVGYAAFVRYHALLLDEQMPAQEAADPLSRLSGWALSGCRTRVSCARRIARDGRVKDAMAVIAASKIDPNLARIAQAGVF